MILPRDITPGRLITSRSTACKKCSTPSAEYLVGTNITPTGVWVLDCKRCGS